MNLISLLLALVITSASVNPIKELYELQKYDQVILRVSESASVEDRTLKAFSYFQLSNYISSYNEGNKLLQENKSDSLKFMLAKSAFYLGNNERWDELTGLISDQELQQKSMDLSSFPETNNILKSVGYRSIQNNGFCFWDGKLLVANGNKLELDGMVVYESPGKYIAYPFVRGNQVLFSANLFDGKDLPEKELGRISRQRISKLQLFIGTIENGIILNVSLLPFNN